MIYQQSIETRGRNDGHTKEDEDAGHKWPYFMLHTRVVIIKDEEDKQHGGKAYRDGKAGPEQDAGNDGQWSHHIISELLNLSLITSERCLCRIRP